MTIQQKAWAKWDALKPQAMALAIGLVVGPLISNYAGWQVTSGAAREDVVEQLASICNVGARAAVPDPAKLDWSARTELASKWAIMPGATVAEPDVMSACERKLQG